MWVSSLHGNPHSARTLYMWQAVGCEEGGCKLTPLLFVLLVCPNVPSGDPGSEGEEKPCKVRYGTALALAVEEGMIPPISSFGGQMSKVDLPEEG